MSTSMPVIPSRANLLQNERELYRFLVACQEKSKIIGSDLIVSLSEVIDSLDPLAVCQAIAQPNQQHFYWENRKEEEAIAAIGAIKSITVNSPDRFSQSQQFVQSCRKQLFRVGELHLPGSEPHFFCSFTFFDLPKNSDYTFPAATIFLPCFQITSQKDCCVLIANVAISYQVHIDLVFHQLKQQIKSIHNASHSVVNLTFPPPEQLIQKAPNHPSHYKAAVAEALKSIHKNRFSKIVLAHALDVISPVPFGLVESLNRLRQRHPDCTIFSTSNGKGNHFIGASPERLLSIQNQQLATDALAGSAPRGKSAAEDASFANQLWKSEKERREHQAVSDFITHRLHQLGLEPQRKPLQLLKLSNIQHLWTPIQAEVPAKVHPLEIVAQLHPTPAVAGVPTDIACEQIRNYETFERALYAAPLGWIDYQGNSKFIVGIRSATIAGNHARLHAGAGIIAGSHPDKELAEIQLKLQTMLKALV
ncbi:MAG: isochorismate synthase [Cyanobacteria bacterium QH_9_48_43]|nr:MAG: isochorismate synthase [Cyanobacteria bacterium QH_10_48_56]PSO67763.1 MAG: isochorismate synthase [Cyanobacteria bacterium QS_1_48_34]PSO81204.1 MAG: isochorismate synthase [Cyanobacteria bacterium QS_5_48_63]PSO83509.1 MAG: isochorismate synthase [Cyanobacteria bacterium QH_9_48_43]PSO94434.1 MAG: isochorismate synthase [Cyanobacteria bacterium SW_6_48_11]PSO96033.1 MAG: isochorismate synthase [Cyanobacteria bacterium QS_6_48_18]PSP05312.1 MAG: isochorismate synthase [Cyanobacteria 